jgi:hypothetical protein
MSTPDGGAVSYHGPYLDEWNEEGGGRRFDAWSVIVEYPTHRTTFWFASESAALAHIDARWRD